MKTKEERREYARQHYLKNKEKYLESARKFRERFPKWDARRDKEKLKAYRRQKYKENKEHFRKLNKKYWDANRDKLMERNKKSRNDVRNKLDAIKLFYGCVNPTCQWDGFFNPYMLDFHHVDPSNKTFPISKMSGLKIESIINEINKCCVLCANCHRLATFDKLNCKSFTICEAVEGWKIKTII